MFDRIASLPIVCVLALSCVTAGAADKAREIPPVLRGTDGRIRLMPGVPVPPRQEGIRIKVAIIDSA